MKHANAQKQANVFKRSVASEWTLDRIAQMSVQEIKQLRENAVRLNEAAVIELCNQALRGASPAAQRSRKRAGAPTKASRLVARTRAFEMRGVALVDPQTSWGGVRKADGAVVLVLWADSIESVDGGCRCLLWAPNVEGSRPWSDTAAGRERLEHCRKALAQGRAEGMLIYGESLDNLLPEHKARAIRGVDPDTLIEFHIEAQGDAFWARWGKAKAASSIGPS